MKATKIILLNIIIAVACSSFVFSQYLGGDGDGFYVGENLTYVAPCILPGYFNIGLGGNADGFHVGENLTYVTPCILPSAFNIGLGGNADGFALGVSSLCDTIITFSPTLILISDAKIQFNTYPNPASTIINLEFYLPQPDRVVLNMYDVSGKKLINICNRNMKQGMHSIQYKMQQLAPGTYFCYLATTQSKVIRKLIIDR